MEIPIGVGSSREDDARLGASGSLARASPSAGIPNAVQCAVLGLIGAHDDGVHGYRLKLDFDARYGEFATLSFGELYRALARLERAGLIEGSSHVQASRPTRRVYRVTASGDRVVKQWLCTASIGRMHCARDELSLRLMFLSDRRHEAVEIIHRQRPLDLDGLASLARRRSLLEPRRSGRSFVEDLLLVRADMRLRADMAWLELVERALVPDQVMEPGPNQRVGDVDAT